MATETLPPTGAEPHHHHHEHNHGTDNSDDFTSRNLAHWNEWASRYTAEDWQKEMVARVSEFIVSLANSNFIYPFSSSQQPRMLDYACGPGTVTAALGSRCSEYVGVDLSQEMVKAYNARFGSEGSGTEEEKKLSAKAVVGNLLEKDVPAHLDEDKFKEFDLAVIGMGFHHFENLELCIERLTERLKVGGVFAIVDLVTHVPEDKYKSIVAHHGFSEEGIKKLFEKCGLRDIGWREMEQPVWMHGKNPRTVFMATGRKSG